MCVPCACRAPPYDDLIDVAHDVQQVLPQAQHQPLLDHRELERRRRRRGRRCGALGLRAVLIVGRRPRRQLLNVQLWSPYTTQSLAAEAVNAN